MSDPLRKCVIRLAASMPKGSTERKALLDVLGSKPGSIEEFYDAVERGITQRPREIESGVGRLHLWFSERFSGWHVDFWADIYEKNGRIWMTILDGNKKYTDPRSAARAIEAERDAQIEERDLGDD